MQQWSKKFIGLEGPLGFYQNIKNSYTTQEKAEENAKRKNNQIQVK